VWTLSELVEQAAQRIEALPSPKNGQVRAVPDERTVRYYAAIGLLERPAAMRGRTALYESRHLAQIVAIKRLQGTGKSLGEIRELWPTLDDLSLARMSGVKVERRAAGGAKDFWKRAPAPSPLPSPSPSPSLSPSPRLELRVELAPNLVLALSADAPIPYISPADLRALRAAAAPLLAELASRGFTRTLEEEP
jgi:DNA-binding transcriptional MerR regulator